MLMETKQIEVEVKNLMQGNKDIVLLLADRRYSLAITRRGKLILTADEAPPNIAKIAIQN